MLPFSPLKTQRTASDPVVPRKVRINLAGLEFEPRLSGALYLAESEALLVSDMHLEQGASLARRGFHAPPFDTLSTLQILEQEMAVLKPRQIVFLGDAFHDRVAAAELPHAYRTKLVGLIDQVQTIWIAGNHDPDAPFGLPGEHMMECKIGPVTLRHEPSRNNRNGYEIAGHLHPGAAVVQRGVATRTKCFAADATRIVMPAFGAYTGALNVHSPAFAKLLDIEKAKLWMIGKTAIHTIPMKRAQ
jgi:uncharacterized protein